MSKRRAQTSTERDLAGIAARRERDAAPEFIEEEGTGQVEGPELEKIRSRRPTPQRIGRVEKRVDKVELSLARMDGKLDAMLEYAARADAERERRSAAEAVALERRRKHIIALISAIGGVVALIVTALASGCLP